MQRRAILIKRFLIKAIPINIAIIVVAAVCHIIYTIKNYHNTLTALPLWMSVTMEAALWLIPIIVGIVIYVLLRK